MEETWDRWRWHPLWLLAAFIIREVLVCEHTENLLDCSRGRPIDRKSLGYSLTPTDFCLTFLREYERVLKLVLGRKFSNDVDVATAGTRYRRAVLWIPSVIYHRLVFLRVGFQYVPSTPTVSGILVWNWIEFVGNWKLFGQI